MFSILLLLSGSALALRDKEMLDLHDSPRLVEVPVGTPAQPEAQKKEIKKAMGRLAKDVITGVSGMKGLNIPGGEAMLGTAVVSLLGDKEVDKMLEENLSTMSTRDMSLIPKALQLIGTELADMGTTGKINKDRLQKEIAALPFSDEVKMPKKKSFNYKAK